MTLGFVVSFEILQFTKEQIYKLDLQKLKPFSLSKIAEMIKRRSQTERKSMQNIYLIKDFYPKYIKNS